MKRGGRVWQQEMIVLLAVYVLKKRSGKSKPKKRKVLDFLRITEIMNITEDEKEFRNKNEVIWENDIAWIRKNLVEKGLILNREFNAWEISNIGEKKIEEWAENTVKINESNTNWKQDFDKQGKNSSYLNIKTMSLLQKVAKKDF